jgi:hypothetical protein
MGVQREAAEEKAGARDRRRVPAGRSRPRKEEVAMQISLERRRNPFAFLFVSSRREQYLTQYVLREYARGRSLRDVLEDPYVRNAPAQSP